MSTLFSPIKIRNIEIKNRCWVSPMCQYSSVDGLANDWHMVHLGTRAIGGAGLVMTEAAAVSPEGRISPSDLGIWDDKHIKPLQRISKFINYHNAIPAIQIAHSGRKGSTKKPWEDGYALDKTNGGWDLIGPSPIPFDERSSTPQEMSISDINKVIENFVDSAKRAEEAGFKCIEIHMAHGYLIHEFLSPLSNKRSDNYGVNLKGRMKLGLEIAKGIKDVISQDTILLSRISATDYINNGWSLSESIEFSKELKIVGVDLIDCSSGGNASNANIKLEPGYQVSFSSQIRKSASIMTGAVGLITEPSHAERILKDNHSDVVFLGREFLRNPYWPLKAEMELDKKNNFPEQYIRAI
jgi:2,4-dienoyl-CoA reductase-like NADH-dependent reductase (Old Yellow Enzyme family)